MFKEYDIQDWIIKTLDENKIKKMTEIQKKTFKDMNNQKNVVGVSYTGSGKTLAFLVPILNKIKFINETQVLIIAPTRELARQLFSVLQMFKKNNNLLTINLFISGNEVSDQINKINRSKPQIIVATVNRIYESLKSEQIKFKTLNNLVLDEADMMLDLGFMSEIDEIIKNVDNNNLQKSGWSATMHEMLAIRLSKIFKNTKIINVGKTIYDNDKIKHYILYTKNKYESLKYLINNSNIYICIIFANTKKEVDEIYKYLLSLNLNATRIHGSLQSRERKNTYNEIKKLNYQYIVASDLASRGLDLEGASHIISWNIPNQVEWYIHRAGRSGRSKYTGESYILYDGSDLKPINNLIDKRISFNHIKIVNNTIKTLKFKQSNKVYLDTNTNNKIKKIINKQKTKKVKPNYKKKQKKEIDKIKQKSKRQYIDKKLKDQRIISYKIKNAKK